jgi:hypothetical protein
MWGTSPHELSQKLAESPSSESTRDLRIRTVAGECLDRQVSINSALILDQPPPKQKILRFKDNLAKKLDRILAAASFVFATKANKV